MVFTQMSPPESGQLAPRCGKCGNRHLPELRCWTGTEAVRDHVFATQGRVCWLCGKAGADSIDHVVPRSRGGTDDPDNLRPAHQVPCNADRRNRTNPFRPDPDPTRAGVGLSPRWRPQP